MRTASAIFQRKGKQALPRIIVSIFGLVILVVCVWFMQRIASSAPFSQSIVVKMDESIKVISINGTKDRITILDVPNDVIVDATGGYGKYTLGSLFTLDRLDKKGGSLFISSISDATGIPISWYVVSPKNALKGIFSWDSIWLFLTRQIDSSVPFWKWISFVLSAQSLPADAVVQVNADSAYVDMQLSDGSSGRLLDQNRFDYTIGTSFMDAGLRGEGLSIAVYNTTEIPFVGQRAARMMSHVGLQLVFVGNSISGDSVCKVAGTSKLLKSKSAQFIREYFRCVNKIVKSESANSIADLSIYLGSRYASMFLQIH